MSETLDPDPRWLAPTRRIALAVLAAVAAAVALVLLGAASADAGRAAPGAFPVEQPDGDPIIVRQWGDEWYSGLESASGHTLLQRADGFWVYARQRADGSLAPSPQVAGRDDPTGARHLRDEVATEQALVQRKSGRTGPSLDDTRLMAPTFVSLREPDGSTGTAARSRGAASASDSMPAAATGAPPSLVILAEFTDRPSLGTTPAQWHDRFFGQGKSVRDYFEKASYGAFTLTPAAETSGTPGDGVVGWVSMDMANPGWVGDRSGNDQLTRRAIIAADPFVDYASYDTDGNGVVRNDELHITVVAAGYDASYGSTDPQRNVWAHHSYLVGEDIPRLDGRWVGGWGYTQLGEMHARPADPTHQTHQATVGIIVHELGHDLELPDLYDYDYDSEAVGDWSLMAAGEWTKIASDTWFGQTPVLPDAWSRATLGWITPTRVVGSSTRTIAAASSGTSSTAAVQLGQNPFGFDWSGFDPGGGEYFLVENRQRTPGSYDEALPGDGLLVLHVDEGNNDNRTTGSRLVDVVEADGLDQLDGLGNEGDAGDLFPGASTTREVGPVTVPNTAWNDGTASGAAITGISDSGPSMTALFTGPANSAPRNDQLAGALTVKPGSWGHRTDITLATVQAGETTQNGCPMGRTVWYRFTPPRDMMLSAHTFGSRVDTVLNLWSGTALGSLTALGCNDEYEQDSGYSYLRDRLVQGGQTYWFQVGGYYDGSTVAAGELSFSVDTWPLNDYFPDAVPLGGASGTVAGNDEYSTQEGGEPRHTGRQFTGSVWHRWTAPTSGQVSFDTLDQGGDTVLAVYTGTNVSALAPVVSNNDVVSGVNLRSRVQFQAVAGTEYRIAVGHVHEGSERGGPFTLRWRQPTLRPATDVAGAPGNQSATVSWQPPAPVEGVDVTGFRVSASDGLSGCTTTGSLSCVVTGLTNGQSYTFTVTALTTYGDGPVSAASATVSPAAPSSAPPVLTAAPTVGPSVTGDARFGTRLVVAAGTWPGVTSHAYAWHRSGVPISGATAAAYTPSRADIGHPITVTVTGSGPGLAPGAATSAAGVVRKALPSYSESRANVKKRTRGVRLGRSILLTFRIGPWADGGRVTAFLAGKRRGSATVASGVVVVRVSSKGVAVGRRPLILRYAGTGVAEPAKRTVRLRVRPAA
ncbi:M6 family metalloprotease domain-containing protein [Nocardioides terrigena]|uniref:M6 family metalloprotease domain-containing protein n=1 Tax=Nocardioides terrigena TaxID=424797 RepID=UPI000D2FAFC2|nr:M6 family metalloprotease domain-containing protein [Nocardioides terrigena]